MKKGILAFTILTMLYGAAAFAVDTKAPAKPTPTPAPKPSPSPSPTPSPSPSPSPGATANAGAGASSLAPAEGESFLDKYPVLKKNLYNEPESNLYLGFSMGILGIIRERMYFSANFFQIHYISSYWDSEILSISYGTTTANPTYVQSNHFVFRTMPMYRLTRFWSFGLVGGWEYVSFPQISGTIFNGSLQTETEPFSTSGAIYGLAASQNFESESKYKFKLTELVYKESYSTENAGHGWRYLFDSNTLKKDTTPIKAGVVMMVEAGFVF